MLCGPTASGLTPLGGVSYFSVWWFGNVLLWEVLGWMLQNSPGSLLNMQLPLPPHSNKYIWDYAQGVIFLTGIPVNSEARPCLGY